MSIKFYNKKTNSWEICGSSHALETPILDIEEHFESENVEGALRELGSSFSELSRDFEEHILNHPSGSGGGGGTVLPTISSTFEGGVLEEGTEIEIDLFFNSPNLGKGTAYVSINGLEAMDVEVKQGNNVINIGVLNGLKNSVMIYVVDRAGLTSNQLAWEIVSGGITMDINFDTEVDYGIDDIIRMPYIITTESRDPVFLNLTIDGVQYTYNSNIGYNEHVFSNLGVGVHKISAFATTGTYKSANHHFNLVVVNSYSLYLSSGTEETVFELGNPININYRISKISSENFTVKQYIDNNLYKELSLPVGNYYWTVNSLDLGYHKLKITAESSSGEFKELEFTIEIKEGSYVPVQPVLGGLIAWFDATEKTNNDLDKNVWVDKIGGNIGTLHNFNYSTNGWLDGKLNCSGKAYVKIDMTPYKDNVKLGSTIDIIYKAKNIGIETARVLDYTDVSSPYKGIYIDLLNAKLSSISNNATVNLDEDREIRVTFVVDRNNKFAFVYIDAVLCRAFSLSDLGSGVNKVYEDFTHNQKIYLNSEKGTKNYGSCEIRHLRIYNRALNYDEILQNHISDIKDLREQRKLYKFNYENTTTPVIRMYGDDSSMTGDISVPMRVKYVSPNEELYGQSFDLNYCQVKWQGTSSLQYVLKNYSIIFKDDTMADYYYSPFKDGTKENILCLKADYMESTHAHNVGLAKFANDCLYSTKNPAQMKNDKIRNAVNGFPILLYINDKLKGVYNFNLDRYSTNSYGYNKTDFPNCLCYEVSANSDTTAGAFHKWTSGSGKTELEYIASDFEVVYPPERVTNDNFVELKRLIDWVSDADDELFRQQIAEHFNLEYLLRYYLFVMVFGLVDSLGKNMKLTTWDGRIWYPQLYDADTALGLDNTGFLKFDVDIEVEPNVFNTSGSKLWSKVARVFAKELSEQYTLMRQDRFTVENIMKYLDGEQISKIPQINYNKDMQTKYLDFGSSYLYACHGNRKHHITRWIRERIAYVDTLMGYDITTSDYITVRANKQGYVYLNLQTYIPLYLKVKWRDEAGGTGTQIKKINRGETVKFEYNMPTATDQEVLIYGGRYLKDIGDVTNLQPTAMLIENASNLTKLTVHSQNLANLDLSKNTNLQHVDISNCTILGSGVGVQSTLDVQSCTNLFELDARGTKLTAVYISTIGGNLETIRYPLSIQSIDLKNLLLLNTIDIPLHSNLASLNLTNCENLKTLRGDLSLNDTELLSELQHCTIVNSMIDRDYFDIVPHNLKTLTIKNLPNVKTVRIGGNTDSSFSKVGTLESVFFENCPNLKGFFFTSYNNDNKNDLWDLSKDYIRLNAKDGLVVDLSRLNNLEKFVDRFLIQGLTELYLPTSIKIIEVLNGFSNSTENLGSVSSTLKKIWCPELCTPSEDFLGFDGTGLELQDVPFTFLTNLKEVVNMNVKYINSLGRYNVLRNSSNFLVPEGTFDYSNLNGTVMNQEFANIKDTNGVMNIIFPNSFSTVNQVSQLFYNATLKNVSWDIANRLLNEIKVIVSGNSTGIFQEAVLSPFNTHTGLYVDNENVRDMISLYKAFKKSNLPRIEKLKVNGLNFLNETFAEIPNILDNSWDVINDIFKDNPELEQCKDTFFKTNMKPFNVYDGVDIEHNNILTIINCFRETNIDKIKRIKSTSLTDISATFYDSKNISGFTWDDVTPMFENDLPNIKEANGTFRGSSIGDTTNGFELTHNSLEKVRAFFYGCVISKINKILLPNVLDAGALFQNANEGNPLNNSWDVVIDFLQNSPNLELARHLCEKIKMQPQTKPLSFNLPNLIELQSAFAETNISDIGVMSCPKLQQAKRAFCKISLPVNSKAPHNILDMITGCQSEIVDMETIMYQTDTESTSDDVYDINWVLPKLSSGSNAFTSKHMTGANKKFRYKISKLVTSANVDRWFTYQILDEYIENVELNGTACSFYASEKSGIEYIDGLITNKASDFNASFANLSKLVEVKNSLLKVSNGTSMFNSCVELKRIDKLDISQLSTATSMFLNLPKLEEIVFVDSINIAIDLSSSPKLTVNTLIHILNSLSNRNGMSSFTLKIGSTNIAKLTPEQLAIATSKNWIIA